MYCLSRPSLRDGGDGDATASTSENVPYSRSSGKQYPCTIRQEELTNAGPKGDKYGDPGDARDDVVSGED